MVARFIVDQHIVCATLTAAAVVSATGLRQTWSSSSAPYRVSLLVDEDSEVFHRATVDDVAYRQLDDIVALAAWMLLTWTSLVRLWQRISTGVAFATAVISMLARTVAHHCHSDVYIGFQYSMFCESQIVLNMPPHIEEQKAICIKDLYQTTVMANRSTAFF
ncbi:hypothetical protein [Plasticicumulans acidivorans]|uniref:hypothetical protein n=1 Tax=Plasticicumulans acidivorans TaxID=886464 RepID=UPI0011B659CC|nr:hypothetical protein [Plasticicumulans acidivorans]